MKVVRLVSELDFGGIEKVVELAALEFNRRKEVELWIVALSHGGKVSQYLTERGIKIFILNKNPKIPNFFLIFRLIRFFKKHQIEVLHTSGAEANFHGLWAALLAGVRVRIGEEIGYPNHHLFWEWLFKITYLTSHRVIVVSEAVQQFIIKKGEVSIDRTRVIYNPVQMENCNSFREKNKDNFRFIVVARLVAIKNIEGLLLAFHKIESEKKKLTIIGEGPEKMKLVKLVENFGICHQVYFLGYQKKVADYLCKADCFVLPSFSEGSSIALAEAMLAQLPSLVTKNGGAAEILGDSGSGFLIDPYDIEKLKVAMISMMTLKESDRLKMGTRARKYALENFPPAKHVDKLLALYSELFYEKN